MISGDGYLFNVGELIDESDLIPKAIAQDAELDFWNEILEIQFGTNGPNSLWGKN